jgi:hypothetical protein
MMAAIYNAFSRVLVIKIMVEADFHHLIKIMVVVDLRHPGSMTL